jgi:hypothetical protein
MPKEVGAALLASAEGYTPRATQLLDAARERLGEIHEVAGWISDNLPQPKTGPARTRKRRRRKKKPGAPEGQQAATPAPVSPPPDGEDKPPVKKRRRRRRKPADTTVGAAGEPAAEPSVEPAQDAA